MLEHNSVVLPAGNIRESMLYAQATGSSFDMCSSPCRVQLQKGWQLLLKSEGDNAHFTFVRPQVYDFLLDEALHGAHYIGSCNPEKTIEYLRDQAESAIGPEA